MKKKKEPIDYAEILKERHEHWDYMLKHGYSDPSWEDGCNLNLTRNHIINTRREIEENFAPENYPEIYHKEVPPEVNRKYMARPEEIRKNAKKSLEIYKQDPNFNYIVSRQNDFSEKTKKSLSLEYIIGYVRGLKYYIETDNLVGMRRHERYKTYLQSFENCASRMREMSPEEMQLAMTFEKKE